MASEEAQFDFGENWKGFSKNAATEAHVGRAVDEFKALLSPIEIRHKSFADVGFGQGLTLLTACSMGAKTVGCDLNPKCAEALAESRRFFPDISVDPKLIIGSILDDDTIENLLNANGHEPYHIVHSWGVLHHTGNMFRAIQQTAKLVANNGWLIIAIYNRHWSSGAWHFIKRRYVLGPNWVRKIMVLTLTPAIALAKSFVTRSNPFKQQRGMDFHYNVIDWVGGFPYEYASIDEIAKFVEPLGFKLSRAIAAKVPTGCNEFVFKRVRA